MYKGRRGVRVILVPGISKCSVGMFIIIRVIVSKTGAREWGRGRAKGGCSGAMYTWECAPGVGGTGRTAGGMRWGGWEEEEE